jgi:hypothetical protein
MISFAAWPSWMTFVIIMVLIGPMWRLILGARGRDTWNRDGVRLRIRGRGREVLREVAGEHIDSALEERDQVIEDLQRRLTEMESRLDFTERLLAERTTESRERQPTPIP